MWHVLMCVQLWFVLMCYFVSCSEEKSDEVTNLLGEVRSVLHALDLIG